MTEQLFEVPLSDMVPAFVMGVGDFSFVLYEGDTHVTVWVVRPEPAATRHVDKFEVVDVDVTAADAAGFTLAQFRKACESWLRG